MSDSVNTSLEAGTLDEDDDAGAVVDTVLDVTRPSFLPKEDLDDIAEGVLLDVVGEELVGVPVFVLPARKDMFSRV